jgi:hypothetical protein
VVFLWLFDDLDCGFIYFELGSASLSSTSPPESHRTCSGLVSVSRSNIRDCLVDDLEERVIREMVGNSCEYTQYIRMDFDAAIWMACCCAVVCCVFLADDSVGSDGALCHAYFLQTSGSQPVVPSLTHRRSEGAPHPLAGSIKGDVKKKHFA